MNRAENKAARRAALEARASFKSWLSQLDDDELDNEDYTYKYEAHTLSLDADAIGDRLVAIESEKARRTAAH